MQRKYKHLHGQIGKKPHQMRSCVNGSAALDANRRIANSSSERSKSLLGSATEGLRRKVLLSRSLCVCRTLYPVVAAEACVENKRRWRLADAALVPHRRCYLQSVLWPTHAQSTCALGCYTLAMAPFQRREPTTGTAYSETSALWMTYADDVTQHSVGLQRNLI